MAAPTLTFHLLGNAHLDPVWLWDWREGLNEGIITCSTILDIMDEDPELTFVRGEAVIYDHIERHAPDVFARIRQRVEEGRWDVVGGTWLQADTNMPATSVFVQHYKRGQDYFRSRFGREVRVAWTADSFGHAAGLPEIYAAAGIESLAFTRPSPKSFGVQSPAFWWEGPGGSRILAYNPAVGWYGTDYGEVSRRLDATLEAARQGELQNVGLFYGLGNHGGGPSRQELADIRDWIARHPEVTVVHSGLHRFFDALRQEVGSTNGPSLPVHRGEMNYVLRGCYASMAGLKFPYRQAEAAVRAAEITDVLVAQDSGRQPADLETLWDGVLFNSFHDILPGSSIERACHDQRDWIGGLLHDSRRVNSDALNSLAAAVDTTRRTPLVPAHPATSALIAWNPHPWPVQTVLELETCVDYRPRRLENGAADVDLQLLDPAGAACAFQRLEHEHMAFAYLPWRFRVATPVTLPPCGYQALEYGWVPDAEPPAYTGPSVGADGDGAIVGDQGRRVSAAVGATGVDITLDGQPLFASPGLGLQVVADDWGSWGGMGEEAESLDLSEVLETWPITDLRVLDSGPLVARLWLRFEGARSWAELTISLRAGEPGIGIDARVLWNERAARLKLVMPATSPDALASARYQVPGGVATRGPAGEVPGGRWVQALDSAGQARFGFVSDALYCYDQQPGLLRASVLRATRFAASERLAGDAEPWRPATDLGEHQFRAVIAPPAAHLDRLAAELETPPTVMLTRCSPGTRPRSASLMALESPALSLLNLAASGPGTLRLAIQNTSDAAAPVRLTLGDQTLDLGELGGWRIGHYTVVRREQAWTRKSD